MNGFDTLRRRYLTAILVLVLAAPALQAQQLRSSGHPKTPSFVQNEGQWSGHGRYLSRYRGLDLWVADDALVYDFRRDEPGGRRGHVVRMAFVGDGPSRAVAASPEVPTRRTYLSPGVRPGFLGIPLWPASIQASSYEQVAVRAIARGIDAVIRDDGGFPRYDIHVAAGVDPSTVRLRFDGADRLSLSRDGALVIHTSIGNIEHRDLFAYQDIGRERRAVMSRFVLHANNEVTFDIAGHDPRHALVIDPLTYSTYLGGVNDDIANGVAVDSSGNAYYVGETASPDFPYTTGAYFATLRGATDAFVTKISPDGTRAVFSTFIGGSDLDAALDVAVSPTGNVYVAGWTSSNDFPARNGYDSTFAGTVDAFVLRLDSTGSALRFSSVLGGSGDDRATAIAIDSVGQIYLAGNTLSSAFPTTPGAYQVSSAGGEGFALKLTANGRTLLYSTFIGGDGREEVVDLAIRRGVAYVAGNSESDGTTGDVFPTSTGAMQTSFGGLLDGFITAIDTNGRGVVYSTLLGSTDIDMVRAIAVDNIGAAHVTGNTRSSAFPTTGGAHQNIISGVQDAFVAKVGPDGAALNFSTFLGGGGIESGEAIGVTPNGLTIVAGNTRSGGFPTSTGAMQTTLAGQQDMFVAELGPLAVSLIYGSYLGGSGNDSLRSAALVGTSTLYMTGTTNSIDYPATIGSLQPFLAGGQDAFATRFELLQITTPNSRVTLCAGDTHVIAWTGSNNVNYDIAVSANNGQTWTPVAFGVVGNSYMWAIPGQQPAGSSYRLRVSVAGTNESDANDSTFTIIARPVVQSNPSSITRAERSTVSFTARGTGTQPVFWQQSTDNGATWETISGSSNDQLTVVAISADMDSTLYRAMYSNQCDTVATQPARLIVQAVRLLTPVGGEVFCAGSTQRFTFTRQHVTAVNIELSTNGGTNWSSIGTNINGDSFDWTIPSSIRPGNDFRIRVVQAAGSANDASDQSFSIHSQPSVVQSPSNVVADQGTAASFTVAGDAFPSFNVQWQSLAPGATEWTDIPDATVGTLLVSGVTLAQSGSQYRAVLRNTCGSDTSGAATLTVNPAASVESETGGTISMAIRPNPVKDLAVITLNITRNGDGRMWVIDARGNVVMALLDETVAAGSRSIQLDTRTLASGAYRVVLMYGGRKITQSFTVVR